MDGHQKYCPCKLDKIAFDTGFRIENRIILIRIGGKRMSNKTFTQKEIEVLRTSPYVQNVSQSMVFFSASFKEQFWKLLCDGKAPRDIVVALGIDPDILGDNRIAGLKAIVKREVKAGKGFRDYITYTGGSSNYMSPEARIKYLEQQVEYKDQEIAFLKK